MPKKSAPKKAQTKPMFSYEVVDHQTTTVTREATKDQWDVDDTSTHHEIMGIVKTEKNGYGDVASSLDLAIGESAYLTYVVYSSGDSFHRDAGRYLYPVALFDTREKAIACATVLERGEPARIKHNLVYLQYHDNDGQVRETCSISWTGYFEHKDYIGVEAVSCLASKYVKTGSTHGRCGW